jgi:hypothetical protein
VIVHLFLSLSLVGLVAVLALPTYRGLMALFSHLNLLIKFGR